MRKIQLYHTDPPKNRRKLVSFGVSLMAGRGLGAGEVECGGLGWVAVLPKATRLPQQDYIVILQSNTYLIAWVES